MDLELLIVCEQIQEDILAYCSSVDPDKKVITEQVLDNLCNIVVVNFLPLK
jgi:hypothetical protein